MDLREDVSIKKKKILREARFFHWSSNTDLILLSESLEAMMRQGRFLVRVREGAGWAERATVSRLT